MAADRSDIRLGEEVNLFCQVTGDPEAKIVWSRVGLEDETWPENVEIQDKRLRIRPIRPPNGGVYRCTADSFAGKYNAYYPLTIQGGMPFDNRNFNQSELVHLLMNLYVLLAAETKVVPVGASVTLKCDTDLDTPLMYSWSKQGSLLPFHAQQDGPILTLKQVRGRDAGTYVCTAQSPTFHRMIQTVLVVTGVIPYFGQNPFSYAKLPTLPGGYLSFELTINFKPEQPSGLILYNGQQGKNADFVSIGMKVSEPPLSQPSLASSLCFY